MKYPFLVNSMFFRTPLDHSPREANVSKQVSSLKRNLRSSGDLSNVSQT